MLELSIEQDEKPGDEDLISFLIRELQFDTVSEIKSIEIMDAVLKILSSQELILLALNTIGRIIGQDSKVVQNCTKHNEKWF